MLSYSRRTLLSSTTLIFDLCSRFEFINLLCLLILITSNGCILEFFVGRFDNNVMSLAESFKSQPLVGRKVGKFSVAIEFELLDVMTAFFDEKSKEANWPSGGVHFDLRT